MRYIAGIDLLRFLGAISVVALHLGAGGQFASWGVGHIYPLVSGTTGVTLFYVISGYLITSIILEEVRRTGQFNWLAFSLKRIVRIFPLYYLALGVVALLGVLGVQHTSDISFRFAAFYSYNFIPRAAYDSWLGSFHTLATEEHFYLVYPAIWVLCLWRGVPVRMICAVMLVLTAVTLTMTQHLNGLFFVGRWTFNAWGPILIGCLFAFYARDLVGRYAGRPDFLIAFLALFVLQIALPLTLVFSLAFGFLLLHLECNQRSRWVRALNAGPVRYLGAISYGIYVWQSVIISTGLERRFIDNPVLAIALVFCLAATSWHLVEKPLVVLRRRIGRASGDMRAGQSVEAVSAQPSNM